mmetsp:Transcript_16096/g.23689  ORF Transcript_16096/g.23689 Transcript_16096/m.23689 type:complete len:203 (+) Transcript_16096:69-677(+)
MLWKRLFILLLIPINANAIEDESSLQNVKEVVQTIANSPVKTREALSDAILSSVHSPAGEIDPKLLEIVTNAGLPRQMVRHLAHAARRKMSLGASISEIEEDMKSLRKPREETKADNNGYKPVHAWAMPDRQHRALSKAILSAIRSPTGTVDPEAMKEAMSEGLSRERILESVRVGRENFLEARRLNREAKKSNSLRASSQV